MQSWNIVGYGWVVQQLQHAIATHTLAHALLITGPEGVGKRTLALTLTRALFCQAPLLADRPCEACTACRRVLSGNHPDLRLVEPEKEGRGVRIEQVRDLEAYLSLTPNESAYKSVIICAVELMNPNASNALLKTLEEPPAYAHLILLASDADTLLPTIVSRSQQLSLRPLAVPTVAQALRERWGAEETVAYRLARLSGGRMGWAVRALTDPTYLQQLDTAFEELWAISQADLPTRFERAQALVQESPRLLQTLEYWRLAWRDVMLIQTGTTEGLMFEEKRPFLQKLAQRGSLAVTTQMLRTLTAARAHLLQNLNPRLELETLFLDWPIL